MNLFNIQYFYDGRFCQNILKIDLKASFSSIEHGLKLNVTKCLGFFFFSMSCFTNDTGECEAGKKSVTFKQRVKPAVKVFHT